jgi:hypothetical protein
MGKLVLMSILIALIAIPVKSARQADPKAGLRMALKRVLIFEAVYVFLLMYVWGRV